jgi:hypothetical protein
MWGDVMALILALFLFTGFGVVMVLIFINALWFLQNDGKTDRDSQDSQWTDKRDSK